MNLKAHTNVEISTTFVTNKMVTNNIDNANIIIIAPGNVTPKRAKTNRTTIVHGNAVPIRSDVYMTIIKLQHSSQKSRYQYSSKPNNHSQQKIKCKLNIPLTKVKLDNSADANIERGHINRPLQGGE